MPIRNPTPHLDETQADDAITSLRGRGAVTRLIAWFMAGSAILFGAFTIVFGAVAERQHIHGLHNAIVASLLLVLSAPPAVAIARRPMSSGTPLMTPCSP